MTHLAPTPSGRSGERSEYDEQVRLFALVDVLAQRHPACAGDLLDVWATSNGGKRPKGEAGRMRAAGQRKGVLDVECLVPRDGFHGLVIEMKSRRGRVTPEQDARAARLAARGYSVHVARSWETAGHILCTYLGLPWPPDAERRVDELLASLRVARKEVRSARGRTIRPCWSHLPTTLRPR